MRKRIRINLLIGILFIILLTACTEDTCSENKSSDQISSANSILQESSTISKEDVENNEKKMNDELEKSMDTINLIVKSVIGDVNVKFTYEFNHETLDDGTDCYVVSVYADKEDKIELLVKIAKVVGENQYYMFDMIEDKYIKINLTNILNINNK